MKHYFLPLLLLVFVVFQGCSKPPYININNQQLQELMQQGVPLYDIRRVDEWKMLGVIKGSHKLTFVDASGRLMPSFLPEFTKNIAKDEPVIILCHVGSRSASLAKYLMKEQGYTTVYNVEDGINGWIREGLPVVGKRRR